MTPSFGPKEATAFFEDLRTMKRIENLPKRTRRNSIVLEATQLVVFKAQCAFLDGRVLEDPRPEGKRLARFLFGYAVMAESPDWCTDYLSKDFWCTLGWNRPCVPPFDEEDFDDRMYWYTKSQEPAAQAFLQSGYITSQYLKGEYNRLREEERENKGEVAEVAEVEPVEDNMSRMNLDDVKNWMVQGNLIDLGLEDLMI